jgi:hypothetical protein
VGAQGSEHTTTLGPFVMRGQTLDATRLGWSHPRNPSLHGEVEVGDVLSVRPWPVGLAVITAQRVAGALRRELVHIDLQTGATTPLVQMADSAGYPQAFMAASWGPEPGFIASVGLPDGRDRFHEIRVYQRVGAAYAHVHTIPTPPGYPWVVSPEVMVWDGEPLVTFVASTAPSNIDNGESTVWVASAHPDVAVYRRLSPGVRGIYKDPEGYVGGVDPFVFFVRVLPDGTRELMRARVSL